MANQLTEMKQAIEGPRLRRLHHQHEQAKGQGAQVDAAALAAELRKVIIGEVRFATEDRALYATDGSNYRQVPIGVVIPREISDVVATVELCRKYKAPLFSRGGGTSLAGQCCNVAVCMDFSKYLNRIKSIDAATKTAVVQPGVVLDSLRHEAVKQCQLTFGPDPETHDHCCMGGMLGNNSCGVHSLLARNDNRGLRVSDNTEELEILTYDGLRMRVGPTSPDELENIIRAGGRRGEIYKQLKALRDKYADQIRARFPKLGRRVSGYNLDELLPENNFNVARALVGTESTCVTILEATMHLVPAPKKRTLLLLGYPDIADCGDHVMEILPYNPIALEGIDQLLFEWVKQKGEHAADLSILPPGQAWLLAEFGGADKQESDAVAKRVMEMIKKQPKPPSMKMVDISEEEEKLWKVREGSLGATAWVPGHPDTWEGWEDAAVPVEKVGPYLREFVALLRKFNYTTSVYGHLGQGCIHCRIPFDFYSAEGVQHYTHFMDQASDLVLKYGGSLSGEHGDGQSRAQFLPKMFGDEIVQAFKEFKTIWDPQFKMNPGKIVEPYGITENLRLGPDYDPPQVSTHFQYPSDQGSFTRGVLRCVGVGACRKHDGQTMCPSYQVTREEKDSTRGRARLLWEMLNGDVLEDGWKSEAVKDSLDLCLSCKGCKGDCPVNVDMATYKAEFLSHYYEGKMRPRHAFAFGLIHVWSKMVSVAPMLANIFTQTPGLSGISKLLANVAPERRVPQFAPESFQHWFARRAPKNIGGPPVLLFPDTFNNYFHTQTSKAAVEVLEDAGFFVRVPQKDVCCGRPLYDYGMLDMAKSWLEDMLLKLQEEIQAGIPMVVLEPSCATVFRDELTNMLPTNKGAQRLKEQTFILAEFLEKKAPHYHPPQLRRKVLLHEHCHQKATWGKGIDKQLLKKMGMDIQAPSDGCCGMAGAFGFEKEHYDLSVKVGEQVLLPDVRKAAEETVILADGFSCREQVEQCTDRHALHLADVMQLALHHGPEGPRQGRPEADYLRANNGALRRAYARTLVIGGAGVLAAGLTIYLAMRNRHRRNA